jgi:hypothetical protein
MADVEWQPLPALWPAPAIWTDVGELMLLVFTQDGVSGRAMSWCRPMRRQGIETRLFCR